VPELTTRMTPTEYGCWKCGNLLNRLTPPVHGWNYHCPVCQHLTLPRDELEAVLAAKNDGTIGVVSALPCRIDVVPQ
jgi:DNA-directed RNA polymerase subunit RPC12/RpoP